MPKKVLRLQVEVYFLNGKGRSWLLNPAKDKLVESKEGNKLVITHGDAEITIHREFVAYYAKIKKMLDLEEENMLKRLAAEGPEDLDLL